MSCISWAGFATNIMLSAKAAHAGCDPIIPTKSKSTKHRPHRRRPAHSGASSAHFGPNSGQNRTAKEKFAEVGTTSAQGRTTPPCRICRQLAEAGRCRLAGTGLRVARPGAGVSRVRPTLGANSVVLGQRWPLVRRTRLHRGKVLPTPRRVRADPARHSPNLPQHGPTCREFDHGFGPSSTMLCSYLMEHMPHTREWAEPFSSGGAERSSFRNVDPIDASGQCSCIRARGWLRPMLRNIPSKRTRNMPQGHVLGGRGMHDIGPKSASAEFGRRRSAPRRVRSGPKRSVSWIIWPRLGPQLAEVIRSGATLWTFGASSVGFIELEFDRI